MIFAAISSRKKKKCDVDWKNDIRQYKNNKGHAFLKHHSIPELRTKKIRRETVMLGLGAENPSSK